MLLGYARVSTVDQSLDPQLDALRAVGVERIFKEKKTGKTRSRQQLEKLLEQLRDGDVVVVTKYDRFASSGFALASLVAARRRSRASAKVAEARARKAANQLDDYWFHLRSRDAELPGKHMLRLRNAGPVELGHVPAVSSASSVLLSEAVDIYLQQKAIARSGSTELLRGPVATS